MRLDWANVGAQELGWTIPAVLAGLITIGMTIWVWRSFAAIRAAIRAEPDRYQAWGPRWNFSLFLLVALSCFGLGWLGYAAIGALAMMTPPPQTEASQDISEWFAWLLVSMEAVHALAQGFLWVALRSLTAQPVVPGRQAGPGVSDQGGGA